jgi:hypothetical protein
MDAWFLMEHAVYWLRDTMSTSRFGLYGSIFGAATGRERVCYFGDGLTSRKYHPGELVIEEGTDDDFVANRKGRVIGKAAVRAAMED